MDVCRELNVNPWVTLMISNMVQTDTREYAELIGAELFKNTTISVLYRRDGSQLNKILMTFNTVSRYENTLSHVQDGTIKLCGTDYPCKPVSDRTLSTSGSATVVTPTSSSSSSSNVRTLKVYSGHSKHSGDYELMKWVEEAYDALDNEKVPESEKMRIIKNGLTIK